MGDVAKLIAELRRGCFLATFGPYTAMKADNMPISCVDYGVVSNTTGREVSRMWLEDDARFHASCSPENITAILDSHEALQKQNAELVEALEKLIRTSVLLQNNAIGCAVNHHQTDFSEQGTPGWLDDTKSDIDKARAALIKAKAPS